MTKVTNIPSRLHSVEQGNVVAGANEILDDTKGKKQNVINQEVDAELLRLEQAKQDNLTFDNTPTENSTNPVTSGGVYAADTLLQQAIEAILLLIPSAASALNQLADKDFVNSTVATNTATFRGTYNVVTDLHLAFDATHAQIEALLPTVIGTADNNDYCYVQIPVSATSEDIAKTERYKYNGTAWSFEYVLNTSGFTAVQWAAINSGITLALVGKLDALPTAVELAGQLAAKQNVLTFDDAPTQGSNNPVKSGGIYTAIKGITDLLPAEATALNQLADKAYVLAQILAATPAFKGQFTSLTDLQAVQTPKAGDLGIVRTKDSDGYDVFTFYQYLSNAWNVYYTLSHHPQTKPATTGTTGDYPYNGMGRVVLPMNIKEIGGVTANYLEQSMMPTATGGNTIYVITHDYVLASDVTIPTNCVLDFEGGSLSGSYELVLNGCFIKGDAKLDVSSFNGNIRNEAFNVLWLMDSDFGAKMNKAAQYFYSLYVPNVEILFATPINISLMQGANINCQARLIYTGALINHGAAITIYGFHSKIYINELQRVGGTNPTGIDFTKTRTVNFIGINIFNSTDIDLHVGFISGFNEGVRCTGLGAGCVDGRIYIQTIWNYNFGVRLFQGKRSTDSRDGWCNGWDISGGTWRSMENTIEEKHAVCIAGALYGGDSYRDTSLTNPTNDGSSRDYIHDIDFENHAYPIYIAGSVRYLQIINCREENVTGLFYVPDNGALNVGALKYLPGYVNRLATSYFKHIESCSQLLSNPQEYDYKFGINNKKYIKYQYNNTFCDGSAWMYSIYSKELVTSTAFSSGLFHGILFPIGQVLNISVILSERGQAQVAYLNANKENITDQIYEEFGNFGSSFYYNASQKLYKTSELSVYSLPIVNRIASYVFIGFACQNVFEKKVKYISEVRPEVKIFQKVGTTAERPTNPDIQYEYYDTDLGKFIYFIGKEWCDALGNPVGTTYQEAVTGTAGNLAGFDANGKLADSGTKPSDFEPAQPANP